MRNLKKNMLASILKKISVYISLLVFWQLCYWIFVDVLKVWKFYSFPEPAGVFNSFLLALHDGTLSQALYISLQRIMTGYGISLAAGVAAGLLLSRSKFLYEGLNGLILGLQTLPNICWLPFAILWFGLGEGSILFVIIIGSVFSISIAVSSGIRNINPVYVKAGRNLGARGMKLFRHVIIPAALPSFLTGMKQGWSFAWRGLIAGEMISASMGLGQMLMAGRELADINQITAVMIVIIAVGVIVEKFCFGILETRMHTVRGLSQ